MKSWFQRLAVFFLIAALVIGGLGWATSEALQLEEYKRQAAADAKRAEQVRMAMWRLDSWIAPHLAREDSRPFAHYSAIHSPIPAMTKNVDPLPPGVVRLPSPLLDSTFPDWMLLHFQYTPGNPPGNCWQSPQVLPGRLSDRLRRRPFELPLRNVTPQRSALLRKISDEFSASLLVAMVKDYSVPAPPTDLAIDSKGLENSIAFQNPPWNIYSQQNSTQPNNDLDSQSAQGKYQPNSNNDFSQRLDTLQKSRQPTRAGIERDPQFDLDSLTSSKENPGTPQSVELGDMVPLWFPYVSQPDYLLLVRYARLGPKDVIQGVVLDWPALQAEMAAIVQDLFPDAAFHPAGAGIPEHPDQLMTMLPVELSPGPPTSLPPRGWTPLRIGLLIAWVAAIVALGAVALGGWSLIDLSERRIRFVSAVTHELRTPLTTLRLYLDMLTSGMVRDDVKREEYLHTLSSESERLHRLISNVLDYSRLERQRAQASPTEIVVQDLVESVRSTWTDRCTASGKELVVQNGVADSTRLITDSALVQQIVGNLIDNACKYSRSAEDRRVWFRTHTNGHGSIVMEVEDCGPGVPQGERRSIFRPFQRGRTADVTAGGVGLGLALAQRWAGMLGGKLEYGKGAQANGACFRLELPTKTPSS